MSTGTVELYDPLEGGGGGNYAPTVSWPNFKRQDVKGLILPDYDSGTEKPYRVAQQTKKGSNEPLFFDDEKKRPRTQNEFTLLTDLRDWTGTSDQFQEKRSEESGPEARQDDGRRRVIFKGKSMLDQLRDALKAGGAPRNARGNYMPEVGGTLSVRWVKLQPIPNTEKSENIFDIKYTAATPESAEKAREFVRNLEPAADGDGLDSSDGPADNTSAGSDDPPY